MPDVKQRAGMTFVPALLFFTIFIYTASMADVKLATRKKKITKLLTVLKRLFPSPKTALQYSTPWELMVAVQLSAQCTDKKVNEVTAKLFKKYRTLDDYVKAKPKEFEKDIYQTGFYKNKTKNVLAAAKIVKEKWKGKLPRTMAELITIPGVARKTANVILGELYGVSEGITVDTHVRRLTNRWGITDHQDAVKIERDLMELVPKKEWLLFGHRVTYYGREYCSARGHKHESCPLAMIEKL